MENYSSIAIILDNSQNMSGLIKQTIIDGVNTIISSQLKLDYFCDLTLSLFNKDISISGPAELSNYSKLNQVSYSLGDSNRSLHKAICQTLDALDNKYVLMDSADRPTRKIVIIVASGEDTYSNQNNTFTLNDLVYTLENDIYSQQKTIDKIRYYIKQLNYNFFIIANNNSNLSSTSFGVSSKYFRTYSQNDPAELFNIFNEVDSKITNYRLHKDF